MDYLEKDVVDRIMKIRVNKGLTKREVASKMNINEGSYARIETGAIALSYKHLASFARCVDMSVIDVLTYPDRYTIVESSEAESPEAILQIRLRKETKDQVLKLVFGDNNIEIINKI